nr:molecular chaperone [uncultured Moellerella sp.]
MKTDCFYRYFWMAIALTISIFSIGTSAADGGLRLGQTRVVFDANSNSAKVTIKNNSQQVYLIKASVMNTPDGNDNKLQLPPFMVTPPMFRLEKDSQSTVLVARSNISQLPTDRESIFYLSFLAIPATSKVGAPEENMTNAQVSVGIRNVIKLFYRPTGLPLHIQEAQGKLTFRQVSNQVLVSNPTPYYLTLAQLTFNTQSVDVRELGPMIAPFSTNTYPALGAISQAHWTVITDYGDLSTSYQAVVTQGASLDATP